MLHEQPFSGHVFVFRGRRGDIVKLLGGMAMVCAYLRIVECVERVVSSRFRRMGWIDHSQILQAMAASICGKTR